MTLPTGGTSRKPEPSTTTTTTTSNPYAAGRSGTRPAQGQAPNQPPQGALTAPPPSLAQQSRTRASPTRPRPGTNATRQIRTPLDPSQGISRLPPVQGPAGRQTQPTASPTRVTPRQQPAGWGGGRVVAPAAPQSAAPSAQPSSVSLPTAPSPSPPSPSSSGFESRLPQVGRSASVERGRGGQIHRGSSSGQGSGSSKSLLPQVGGHTGVAAAATARAPPSLPTISGSGAGAGAGAAGVAGALPPALSPKGDAGVLGVPRSSSNAQLSGEGPAAGGGAGEAAGSGGSGGGAGAGEAPACEGCGQAFAPGVRCLGALGGKWHPHCFKCGHCRQPISPSGSPAAESFSQVEGDPRPYHPACARLLAAPRCHVCAQHVPVNEEGEVCYCENDFWEQPFCGEHDPQEVQRLCCWTCRRLPEPGTRWELLPDGRPMCGGCRTTALWDTASAAPLYGEVLAFYRQALKLQHPDKPPLGVVDGATLAEYAKAAGRKAGDDASMLHVRGLCATNIISETPWELQQTPVGSSRAPIPREAPPKAGPKAVAPIATISGGRKNVVCLVKQLLLHAGLPRLLCGSVMAHELMHAWLRMAGVVGLELQVEEGLCQLMACLWLDRQHELMQGDPEQQRLAAFLLHHIRNDGSRVYGDGYRAALAAHSAIGLQAVLANVRKHGRYSP